MSINKKIFETEGHNICDSLINGAYILFQEAEISAGRLNNLDPKIGRMLAFDKLVLVARGYQIKALVEQIHQLDSSDTNAIQELNRKLVAVCRGPFTETNLILEEMLKAMDVYTREGWTGLVCGNRVI